MSRFIESITKWYPLPITVARQSMHEAFPGRLHFRCDAAIGRADLISLPQSQTGGAGEKNEMNLRSMRRRKTPLLTLVGFRPPK
jgi:hypothetical protein